MTPEGWNAVAHLAIGAGGGVSAVTGFCRAAVARGVSAARGQADALRQKFAKPEPLDEWGKHPKTLGRGIETY